MSAANRQTQSKDPVFSSDSNHDDASFAVSIRFFDEHEAEHLPIPSREAAERESPARQCRVSTAEETSPVGTAQLGQTSR